MDALDLLKTDHARVKDLFEQMRAESGDQHKILLFENIRNDLETLGYMEETVFLPTFRKYGDLKSLLERADRSQQKIKEMLAEIGAPIRDFKQATGKLQKLHGEVEEHIRLEEAELFPKIRQLMRRPEREQLGRHLMAAKHEKTEAA